jgi:hypothetical protein
MKILKVDEAGVLNLDCKINCYLANYLFHNLGIINNR